MYSFLNELCDLLFDRGSTCQFDAIHEHSIQLGIYHMFNEALYSLGDRASDFAAALQQTQYGCLMATLSQSEG